jgi:GH35 family endo-1,4-beta-xylanase
VRQHLNAARVADPGATLLINEVLTQYPVYPLLDALRDESGAPLYDGVGIQTHMHYGPWSLRRVWNICESFSRLGVPLHFSEVTVLSGGRGREERWLPGSYEYEVMQAEYVPRLYQVLFAHPHVAEITWWDFSDLGGWKGAAAGLLRDDMSRKPACEQLEGLIKERWWTRVRGQTDEHGEFSFRAFHGRHQVIMGDPAGRHVAREIEWTGENAGVVEYELDW